MTVLDRCCLYAHMDYDRDGTGEHQHLRGQPIGRVAATCRRSKLSPTLYALFRVVDIHSIEEIPAAVRQEIVSVIRKLLERQIEFT